MAYYAITNAKIADRFYSRSGTYLVLRVFFSLIGAVGALYRYLSIVNLPQNNIPHDAYSLLIEVIRGAAGLVFIELIAYFFFREYRRGADEFKYYEEVKRRREDNLVILKIFAENTTIASPESVIALLHLFESGGRLTKEETTELLESRKLEATDYNVIASIASAFASLQAQKK